MWLVDNFSSGKMSRALKNIGIKLETNFYKNLTANIKFTDKNNREELIISANVLLL